MTRRRTSGGNPSKGQEYRRVGGGGGVRVRGSRQAGGGLEGEDLWWQVRTPSCYLQACTS